MLGPGVLFATAFSSLKHLSKVVFCAASGDWDGRMGRFVTEPSREPPDDLNDYIARQLLYNLPWLTVARVGFEERTRGGEGEIEESSVDDNADEWADKAWWD